MHVLLRARYDEHGRVGEIVHAVRDVSERKAQEAQLREARALFEAAFEHAPIGMALQDRDGRFIKVNRELCRFTGYRPEQLAGRTFAEITHLEDAKGDRRALRELLDGARESYSTEKRYVCADGRTIWVALSLSGIRDESGEVRYLVAQTQDITERRSFRGPGLRFLADHDPLTDLYNRRRFESELERQVQLSRSRGRPGARDARPRPLQIPQRLARAFGWRPRDRARRLRAAEPAAQLRHPRADRRRRVRADPPAHRRHDARWIAEELILQIEADPFCHDQHSYTLSASAGIVGLGRDTASAEDALVNADIALYDAKRSGRNRLGVHRPEGRRDVLAGLSWSQLLKTALAQERFVLYRQPIVDLSTARRSGTNCSCGCSAPTAR